ncbi:MAG: HRDC domain-containing protein [Planctomycetota bacterium]
MSVSHQGTPLRQPRGAPSAQRVELSSWVDTQDELDRLVRRLRAQPVVAADTEADSFYSYAVKICLFQFSTSEGDYLVDPLANLDLSGLGELFADSSVEIVFHAAENDIGLLKYLHRFRFARLFDTMLAAQILGFRRCGLAALLDEYFGVAVPKSLQTSDWRQRPLTPAQIDYACTDTHYLIPLRDRLVAELERKGRLDEARSEFERIAQCDWEPRPFDPHGFVHIHGARQLDPLSLRCLKELYLCRDRLAKKQDRAPYRVLTEAELLRIAATRPRTAAQLAACGRLKAWRAEKLAPVLLKVLERAIRKGPLRALPVPSNTRRTRAPELSEQEKRLFEALRSWREETAARREVIASRVATTAMLVGIARRAPRSLEELAKLPGMAPWRLEEYGQAILRIVALRGR